MSAAPVCFSSQTASLLCPLIFLAPPSEPRSPTHESTNVTCTIGWVAPLYNGGRSDTFYNITYVDECSIISGRSNSITTTNTSYVINNLNPATTYQIRITAENGVSANEVSLDQLHQRTATVTCTTKEGGGYRYLYACSSPSLCVYSGLAC